jgi:hypothetical protein
MSELDHFVDTTTIGNTPTGPKQPAFGSATIGLNRGAGTPAPPCSYSFTTDPAPGRLPSVSGFCRRVRRRVVLRADVPARAARAAIGVPSSRGIMVPVQP